MPEPSLTLANGDVVHVGDRVALRLNNTSFGEAGFSFADKGLPQGAGVIRGLPKPGQPGTFLVLCLDEFPAGWDHEGDELDHYAEPSEVIGLLPAAMDRTAVESWLAQ